MKTRINLYASLLAITILTGCSSSPVYDSESETTEIDTTEIDNADVKTAEVESAEIEVVPVVVDVATVFYFDFDKALLTAESRADLLENAVVLASNTRSVRLEGHADERGTREYNMALGERRATSVKEFLVMQGVASDRIEVISFGEERAAAYGSDDDAWRLNRRVELK
ncbi:MAG: OmpA family protein [Porticoccaceae bacterium]|nr:OmpA family protein [Porticoccaceae bacterium]